MRAGKPLEPNDVDVNMCKLNLMVPCQGESSTRMRHLQISHAHLAWYRCAEQSTAAAAAVATASCCRLLPVAAVAATADTHQRSHFDRGTTT